MKTLKSTSSLRTANVVTTCVNVPVFGKRIPAAVIEIFQSEDMGRLAEELGVRLPRYTLQAVVQSKMHKVRHLIDEARKRPDCRAPPNSTAVNKLERFVTRFAELQPARGNQPGTISTPQEWKAFIDEHVQPGWEDRLHFDHLLDNFGFEKHVGEELRKVQHIEVNPTTGAEEKQTLQHYSFRWLSKAFTGFNVEGCLADVVNLLFAMAGKTERDYGTEKPSDIEVVKVISETGRKICDDDLQGLWIPTHVAIDAENDDLLCWLLLEYVHQRLGTELKVLVQLPKDEAFEPINGFLKGRQNVTICRDPESQNGQAVADAYKWKFSELRWRGE